MVADRPADQHDVAGADPRHAEPQPGAAHADAGGGQIQAAALPARQHLRVAGDHPRRRIRRRARHPRPAAIRSRQVEFAKPSSIRKLRLSQPGRRPLPRGR